MASGSRMPTSVSSENLMIVQSVLNKNHPLPTPRGKLDDKLKKPDYYLGKPRKKTPEKQDKCKFTFKKHIRNRTKTSGPIVKQSNQNADSSNPANLSQPLDEETHEYITETITEDITPNMSQKSETSGPESMTELNEIMDEIYESNEIISEPIHDFPNIEVHDLIQLDDFPNTSPICPGINCSKHTSSHPQSELPTVQHAILQPETVSVAVTENHTNFKKHVSSSSETVQQVHNPISPPRMLEVPRVGNSSAAIKEKKLKRYKESSENLNWKLFVAVVCLGGIAIRFQDHLTAVGTSVLNYIHGQMN